MAYVPATSSRLLVGSYNLTSTLTAATADNMRTMLDTTTLSDTAETFISGLANASFNLSGWYDPTTTANLQADQLKTWSASATGSPVTFAPRGLIGGTEAFLINALSANFMIGSEVAGVVNYTFEAQQDGAVDVGKVLGTTVPTTANTNEASSNNGSATSNGSVASLHVLAYSGFASVAVKVQHSTDNSSWSDLTTFASVTGLTSERKTSSGTVNQYLRVVSTVSGTGSISYYVAIARR